ncbi:ABC transporter permease [Aureivirga sp. CE67]|uniref:ABC transporter permease n=1 Tax=Aureivirga sp. CE67 TaxID=1788983 RepID=UPI0018C90D2B|nr:ABC transporter permease [Aureivirga sp. CE67]
MLRLLQIELIKLKYNKAAKVLSIVYFSLLLCIALIASIKFNFGGFKFSVADSGIFNFPYIWHFNTYVAATLKFFLLLVIVSMVSNEYSNKTLKQNLIDGLSKKEFVLSKFYTVLLFSVISTVFVFIVSLILGLVFSSYTEFSIVFSDLDFLLAYFIKLVAFFSMGLFFGILVKRSAFAIGAMILFAIVEWIIYLVLTFGIEMQNPNAILQFLPFNAMSNLIKQPFTRISGVGQLANSVGETLKPNFGAAWYEYIIVLVWIFLFIFLSFKLLKKRDL